MSADGGQRDQWGETAEERHARILARDLAWMTYAEACARDGVPRSERDHLIFNDGYAAGRADHLPGAGVVAEEPEWEYGVQDYRPPGYMIVPVEMTKAERESYYGTRPCMRRRAAGPWVPVEQGEGS